VSDVPDFNSPAWKKAVEEVSAVQEQKRSDTEKRSDEQIASKAADDIFGMFAGIILRINERIENRLFDGIGEEAAAVKFDDVYDVVLAAVKQSTTGLEKIYNETILERDSLARKLDNRAEQSRASSSADKAEYCECGCGAYKGKAETAGKDKDELRPKN
jgi:hypothetical protein